MNVLLTVRVPRAARRQCLVPEFRAAVHQDSLATKTASAAVLPFPTPGRHRRRSSAVRAATVSVFELYPAAIAFHSRTITPLPCEHSASLLLQFMHTSFINSSIALFWIHSTVIDWSKLIHIVSQTGKPWSNRSKMAVMGKTVAKISRELGRNTERAENWGRKKNKFKFRH